MRDIRQTISNLESLAERPGSKAEGAAAEAAAMRLATDYGFSCKFTAKPGQPTQRQASAPRPSSQYTPPVRPVRPIVVPETVLEYERVLIKDGWIRTPTINYSYRSRHYPNQEMQIGLVSRVWACRHRRLDANDNDDISTLFMTSNPHQLATYLRSQSCKIERNCPW